MKSAKALRFGSLLAVIFYALACLAAFLLRKRRVNCPACQKSFAARKSYLMTAHKQIGERHYRYVCRKCGAK
jgi:transposase-like protein